MAAVGFLLIFYSYIDYHGPNVMRVARNLLFISTNTVSVLSILLNISCASLGPIGVSLPSKPFIKYPPFFLSVTSSVNTCSTVEGDGSKAVLRLRVRRFSRGRLKVGFQTTHMLTANEIVKEQMIQTTSRRIVKSSEK